MRVLWLLKNESEHVNLYLFCLLISPVYRVTDKNYNDFLRGPMKYKALRQRTDLASSVCTLALGLCIYPYRSSKSRYSH